MMMILGYGQTDAMLKTLLREISVGTEANTSEGTCDDAVLNTSKNGVECSALTVSIIFSNFGGSGKTMPLDQAVVNSLCSGFTDSKVNKACTGKEGLQPKIYEPTDS